MSKYTPAALAQLVVTNSIVFLPHHNCAICEAPVGYVFKDSEVFYDSNCDCPGRSDLRKSSYEELSAWLMKMSSDADRDKFLQGLG